MVSWLRGNKGHRIVLLVVAAIGIGGYAISPAISGGPFTKKAAKKLFYTKGKADQTFAEEGSAYTKAEADARYADEGSTYTKAEADARYPAVSGETRLNIEPKEWQVENSSLRDLTVESLKLTTPGMATVFATLPITVPVQLYARPLTVTGFEFCYDTESNVFMDDIHLYANRFTAADPDGSQGPVVVEDVTNRSDSTCRTYNAPSPLQLTTDHTLVIWMFLEYSAAGTMEFGRTTLFLRS